MPDTAAPVVPRPSLDDMLPALLLVLTGTTGVVDAVSYLALGRVFTANMTGNVVFLGFAMGGASELSIPCSIAALLAFYSGAVIGGRMGAMMGAGPKKTWVTSSFVVESILLLASAIVALEFSPRSGDEIRLYAIVIVVAVAMGLRNATVRKLAIPNLTTTVLTLTIAGLGADSSMAGGASPALGRRIGSVVVMFAGALVGAILLRQSVSLPLFVASCAALVCAVVAMLAGEGGSHESSSRPA